MLGIAQLMFQKVVFEFGTTILLVAFIWNLARAGTIRTFFKRLLWTFAIFCAGWLTLLGVVMGIFFNAYY